MMVVYILPLLRAWVLIYIYTYIYIYMVVFYVF
jgi:hypothetical protein